MERSHDESTAEGQSAGVESLLREAAAGRVGVDRRFLSAVLEHNDPPGILRYARESHEGEKIELDPLLIDLFRHYQTQPDLSSASNEAALEFYLDAIRRSPEDVDDSLIQALLPFGEKAIGPLLALYEELGEEQGSDLAFLMAALRVRDSRVLAILLDRLEYDAADGAFCLGLYGDPAAKPALEKMLSEVPEGDAELRREIEFAIEQIAAPEPRYQPEPFDIYAEYPEHALPPFDLLEDSERLSMLASPEADVRAGAAHSFFNQELEPEVRGALFRLAESDPEPAVRGEAWASLGEVASDETREGKKIREAMIAALNDASKPIEERGGAGVGLYAVAERDEVRKGLEALYELGGKARVKALEAMWRSLYEPYAKYFAPHLDDALPENKDVELLRHALRGAGYFRLTQQIDKIASFFDREEPYDDLRDDALFAYALAMPGETSRGRVKGMLRKIDGLAGLSQAETELVMFALDERLRLNGMAPVFEAEEHADHDHDELHEHAVHDHAHHDHAGHDHGGHDHAHAHNGAAPVSSAPKVGRNDPCPCGSGKKYKKCHGA